MRHKYTDEEVDEIEIVTHYNYSETLMKSGLKSKVKQYKSNKAKGYTPKENAPKNIIYGLLLFAYGDNIYYDCSCASSDTAKNDDVIILTLRELMLMYCRSIQKTC